MLSNTPIARSICTGDLNWSDPAGTNWKVETLA